MPDNSLFNEAFSRAIDFASSVKSSIISLDDTFMADRMFSFSILDSFSSLIPPITPLWPISKLTSIPLHL